MLDTSAIVAWLREEPGWERVDQALDQASISAVAPVEITEIIARKGVEIDIGRVIPGAVVHPFDSDQAMVAGALLIQHRRSGMSLGDACCIPLAVSLDAEVLTTDPAWARFQVPVALTLIR